MDVKGAAKGIAMALFMAALILQAPGVTEATSRKCKILIGICEASCSITIKPPLCLKQCIPRSCLKAKSAEALNSCILRCKASVCFKRYSAAEKIEDCLASCYDDCKKSPTKS